MGKQAAAALLLLSVIAYFCPGLLAQYDKEFDYIQLVLQWSISICSAKLDCAMNPLPFNFTIHGFRPRNYYGDPLLYCYDVEYTPITWQDLIDGLNKNWPDLIYGLNEDNWMYQWKKHGTCALIFYYQMMYFDLAVELKESYDLLGGLEGNEIVPTNLFPYSVQEIKDAVKSITKKDPDVDCVRSRRGKLLISDIRLCFTRGGEIMDCFPNALAIGCTNPFAYFPETFM